ncbi:MAG: MFS transporter [Pseudomonadales bacterium]|nr:MFS transporter [Pseudomonadales bacterium]MCP5332796.1 MFS transporter [Pseudomonadales bacterium]
MATETPAQSSLAALLRQRAFIFFWLARVCTASAFQMQGVVLGWQVYQLTGRALDLGLVGLCQFLPRVVLTPWAGHVADRFDRRRVTLLMQLLQGILLLLLCLVSAQGAVNRELVLLLVALGGAARTFEVPATQALLSAVVPPLLLPRAVAISSSAMQAATLIGPVVAGLLYLLGATEAYGVTALLYVAAAAMMAAVRPLVHQDRSGPQSNFLASFMEGIRFLRRQPMLLGAISLDMFAVLLGGATALLPIIADQLLQTGPVGLGLLRAAPAVGALAMSFWLASHPLHAAGRALFLGVALFGLATLALGLSRSLPLSLAILLLLGAADMVSVVIRQTLVQLHTPDEMRGRVSSVNAIFIGASNQLGEFESGLTAQWFGLVPSILLGGSGTLLVVGLWMRWFPQLLQVRSLEEAMPAQNRP